MKYNVTNQELSRKINMRCWIAFTLTLAILLANVSLAEAQRTLRGGIVVPEDARTVVVKPDDYPAEIGSLNRAIEEEIVVDPETIFILQRDAVYFTDGSTIEIVDHRLHLMAEDGDGHPPIIRPGTDLIGQTDRIITSYNDLILEGIYIISINEEGIPSPTITHSGAERVVIFDKGWIVGTSSTTFNVVGEDNNFFVTNSVFANGGRTSSWDFGRLFDFRDVYQDTVWVENSTLYNFEHAKIRMTRGANYLFVNHNTGYNVLGYVAIGSSEKAIIKNNLFINFRARSSSNPDVGIITHSERGDGTDADREIIIRNNNIGFLDDGYKAILDQYDRAVQAPLDSGFTSWLDPDIGATVLYEENFEEGVDFADEPDNMEDWVIAYLEQSDERPWPYDKWNEVGDYMGAGRHFTLNELRDFSYSSEHESYTAAEDGYPVGDLNWFPDLKAQWEAGVVVSTEEPGNSIKSFKLLGNYPNPFNPITNIAYTLPTSAEVTVQIYNILGQNVKTAELGMKSIGRHEVSFNASDLPSGIYLVRLKAGSEVQTLRITLVK